MDKLQQIFSINTLNKFKNDFLNEQNNQYLPYIVAVTCCCLVYLGISSNNSSGGKKKRRPKKKSKKSAGSNLRLKQDPPKPKKTNQEMINDVNSKFESEYKKGILELLDNFNPEEEKDTYKKKYFGEMLLKLLIELDGVDLTIVQDGELKNELKLKRKESIKEIQSFLKKVDALK